MGVLAQNDVLKERGYTRVSPWFLPNVLVDSASGQIAIDLGLRGPNYAPVSACATGSHAVGEAAELIRRGDADVVLAGGTESCMHPVILAGFTAMRGLVAEEDDPTRASRPFDATRAGFVMGEGACVLLLEDFERADARGARMYGEVLGYGTSNDAHHMAQPDPESVGVAEMMRAALERAGVVPERVGYINAHGTSTPQGDLAETKAIKEVFGEPCVRTRCVLDEVGARPPLRCGGSGRSDDVRACSPRRCPSADDQLPDARPRLRPRLRPERSATRTGRCRPLQRDGPRRPQCVRAPRPRQLLTRARAFVRVVSRVADEVDGDFRERVHGGICEQQGIRRRRIASVRYRDHAHRCRVRGADPVLRVFDRRTAVRLGRRADGRLPGKRRERACRARPPPRRPLPRNSEYSPARSSTRSIRGRLDDEASPSRKAPASRWTASTAPSSNGTCSA